MVSRGSTVTRRNRDGSTTTTTFKGGKAVSTTTTPSSRGSSSSSSSSSSSRRSYVDSFGVIRREGGTGFKESEYTSAVSSGQKGASGLPKTTINSNTNQQGVIQGKVYTGVSSQEILQNRLNPNNTQARVLFNTTARRNEMMEINRRLSQGVPLTAQQEFFLKSGVTPANIDSLNRAISSVSADPLGASERARSIEQFQKQTQPRQVVSGSVKSEELQRLEKLEAQYERAEKRLEDYGKRREGVSANIRAFLQTTQRFTLSPLLSKTAIGRKTLDFQQRVSTELLTMLATDLPQLPSILADQIITGVSVSRGLSQKQLTDIYAKSIRDAPKSVAQSYNPTKPQGVANLILLGGLVRLGAVKNIKTVPASTKASSLRVGAIVNVKGKGIRIVTRGGRYIKPKGSVAQALKIADKISKPKRVKATQTARAVAKSKRTTALKGKEQRLVKKAENTKLNKATIRDGKILAKQMKITKSQLPKFLKTYQKFRSDLLNNKTLDFKRALLLEKIAKKSQIARIRQAKIAKKTAIAKRTALSKQKVKPKKIPKLAKETARVIAKSKRTTKLTPREQRLLNAVNRRKELRATIIAGKALAKQMKITKSQLPKFLKVYQKFRKDLVQGKTLDFKRALRLEKIAKKSQLERIKASKLRSSQKVKEFRRIRKQVERDALKQILRGRLKITDKKYKVIKKIQPMSKKQAEILARIVQSRIDRIDNKIYERQARSVMKDIIEGQVVQIADPKLKSAIKRLLNRQQLADLRKSRLRLIQQGQVKGRTPRTALPKSRKQIIKQQAKQRAIQEKELNRLARIARKKEKRQFAGQAKERKIRRQQYIKEVEKEILKNRGIEITRITPKKLNARIVTAEKVLKKTQPKKGEITTTRSDGTIQVLKTETKTTLKAKTNLQAKRAQLQKQLTQLRKVLVRKTKRKVIQRTKSLNKLKSIQKVATVSGAISSLLTSTRSLSRIANRLALAPALDNQQQFRLDFKRISDILPAIKSDVKQLQQQDLTQAQRQDLRQITQQIQKINKKIPKIEKLPLKLPLPSLKGNKIIKAKGKRQITYDVIYKRRGEVKRLRRNVPLNRALRVANAKIDNTLARSFQLVPVGTTTRKDIAQVSLRKYRIRKNKKSGALILVEKSKFIADTKGEKLALRRARNVKKNKNTAVRKTRSKKRINGAPNKQSRANSKRSKSSRNTKRS